LAIAINRRLTINTLKLKDYLTLSIGINRGAAVGSGVMRDGIRQTCTWPNPAIPSEVLKPVTVFFPH
jgi:hypothetical protein